MQPRTAASLAVRNEAWVQMAQLVADDPRFVRRVRELHSLYPGTWPTQEDSIISVPFEIYMELLYLGTTIGFGSLGAGGLILLQAFVEADLKLATIEERRLEIRIRPEETQASFLNRVGQEAKSFWLHDHGAARIVGRYIEWFFQHFCMNRSAIEIGQRYGYSVDEVRRGIRRARVILGVRHRRGRPPKEHYASRS